MSAYNTPGVYIEHGYASAPPALPTGVPAFLGYVAHPLSDADDQAQPSAGPVQLTRREDYFSTFGVPLIDSFLFHAVDGFFANGGRACYVAPLNRSDLSPQRRPEDRLQAILETLDPLDDIDLVCIPDLARFCRVGNDSFDFSLASVLQNEILSYCDERNDRFALLEPLSFLARGSVGVQVDDALAHRQALDGTNGALYYPWIKIWDRAGVPRAIPPCGQVAGVYARSDRAVGVHKAPANEALEGVADLALDLGDTEKQRLHAADVNALCAVAGRGIRICGARTLSQDPAWAYVNIRRTVLTTGRWIERYLADVAFESNGPRLWARVRRQLTAYLDDLYRQGALKGATAQEAYYVKCDAETNPPEEREEGRVVTEIALAPLAPAEFVIVRIEQSAAGVNLGGSA